MSIVVLDGYTLNPGDLDWESLGELGDLVVYDRTSKDEVAGRIVGATAVFTNKVPIGAEVLNSNPTLRYIGVMATGYNIVDVSCAKQQGILVTNVPGYSTSSVVQMTFSLLLELCVRVQRHSDAVVGGRWSAGPDFLFWDYPLVELAGKKLGIVGFGTIGQGVADVAQAFGMEVLGYSRTRTDQTARPYFQWVELEELFKSIGRRQSTLSTDPSTENLINRDTLALMKRSAILINTSRGGLVKAEDLANALNEERLAGAGVDVLLEEPPPADHPLFNAKNCLITPHIAWATKESRKRLMNQMVDNFRSFLSGNPINAV